MNQKKWLRAAKYSSYVLVIAALYVLQTTPGFLTVFGVKPNFVIPAAICIAMLEDEFVGGLYGAYAGVLCDLGGFALFGFNAIIVMAACVFVGLLVIYMLRPSIINFVLLLLASLLARGMLDFLLNFFMWGYENVWMVLAHSILPAALYSVAVSPLIFYLFRWMFRGFEARMED